MNQAAFAHALLNPDHCPPGFATWNDSDPAVRFNVYRNNVIVSLVAALRDTFAVTCKLVGEEFFNAMTREFVLAHPPHSPLLCTYGTVSPNFALFIADFAPARSVPYLADVARLEAQRVMSYHAGDATSVSAEHIAGLLADASRLRELRFALPPSLAIVRSSFAIVSLWAAHQDMLPPSEVNPFAPEDALVLRQDLSVRIVRLAPGDADFIEQLLQSIPVALAAEHAFSKTSQFDLPAALATLIRYNAVTSISISL